MNVRMVHAEDGVQDADGLPQVLPAVSVLDPVRGEHVSGLVDTQLCSAVSQRLLGVVPCSLSVTNLDVTECGTALALTQCPFWSTCTPSASHSFAMQGGSAKVSLCQIVVWRVALAAGLLIAAMVAVGVVLSKSLSRSTTAKIKAYRASLVLMENTGASQHTSRKMTTKAASKPAPLPPKCVKPEGTSHRRRA